MIENLEKMLLEMPLSGIMNIISIIEKHPEITSIEVKTKDVAIAEVKGEL